MTRHNHRWAVSREGHALPTLFGSDRKLCFLAGSGVSVDPPSNLPTGLQMTRDLLAQVAPSEKLEQVLCLTNAENSDALAGGRFLRFEQLVQLIAELDPELRVLDRLAECEEPNANHLALAALLSSGHDVFTTNFDHLIERALLRLGVQRQDIRPVISRSDWEETRRENEHTLYKLHGSLIDFRTNSASRESIQATIRQVTRQKKFGVNLEPWKKKTFENALMGSDLVVVGYSGLDDFDILPAIRDIKSERRIIWIEHAEDLPINDAEIHVVETGTAQGDISRIGVYLLSLGQTCREPSELLRIRVHTKQLLQWISAQRSSASLTLPSESEAAESGSGPAASLVLSEARKWFFVGEIYSYFDSHEAMQLFRRALSLAKIDRDRRLEGRCMTLIARQHEAMLDRVGKSDEQRDAHWKDAKANLDAALKIVAKLPHREDRQREATVLNNLGMLFRCRSRRSNIRRANDYFARALAINERIDDRAGQSGNLNNIGAADYALGDLDAAIHKCAQACAIDRSLGDLSELAVHQANVGKFRCDKGEELGVDLLQESIEIGRALGHIDLVGNAYNHLGLFYAERERWPEALECYDQAIEYAEGAGSVQVESFRRSAHAVRTRMSESANRKKEQLRMSTKPERDQREPATIDPAAIVMIVVLVPAGQPIADDRLAEFVLSSYGQVNQRLSESLRAAGRWTKVRIGYGEAPPNPSDGMMGLAYAQAKVEQTRGRTVLIQGGFELSEAARRSGLPSEIWFLTVIRTPSGRKPLVGFVTNGPLTPENA